MFNRDALEAIERVLLRSSALYAISHTRPLREALAACLNSTWQKIEAGKPGSWPEDLPPVVIVGGPRLGLFLEEMLLLVGVPINEIRAIEIRPAFSMRVWPHCVEATLGSAPTETIYRA